MADGRTFIAGEAFTVADITLLCCVDFMRVLKVKLDADQHPNLVRWYDHVSARESVAASK